MPRNCMASARKWASSAKEDLLPGLLSLKWPRRPNSATKTSRFSISALSKPCDLGAFEGESQPAQIVQARAGRLRLIPKRPETYSRQTTFQFQLASPMPELAGNSCTSPFQRRTAAHASRAGGSTGLLEYQGCGPTLVEGGQCSHPVQWCGGPVPVPRPVSLSGASLGSEATGCVPGSRSRGTGARIIRRRTPGTSICHRSRNWSISLTPITGYPSVWLTERFR